MQKLLKMRVRPYYIYQCDLSRGIGHFRTAVGKGIEIMESLRGHTSGLAIPQYVIDAPGGGGKIPVSPQYLISQTDRQVVLRNYQGKIFVYTEPENNRSNCDCPSCRKSVKFTAAKEGLPA
jgi:lysine 2,3-aminomutase